MTIDDCRPPVRRPRRSNSLNDVGRLIGIAHTVYDDREVRAHAVLLSNSEANAWSNYWKIRSLDLQASGMGFKLVPNDRPMQSDAPRCKATLGADILRKTC